MENLKVGHRYVIHSYKHNESIHRAWDEAILLRNQMADHGEQRNLLSCISLKRNGLI